jgi:hypothetical protein
MSPSQVVILIVVVLVVAAVVVFAVIAGRRRRLQSRFGPEYDRVVAEQESRSAAERELRERERRHAELELRELTPEARERYATGWADVQARFVDDPAAAVGAADELVTGLAAERGYPTENYEDQLATLSVAHARTLGHYRDAHAISVKQSRGEATTEELRMAMVHYRELFADLLGERPVPAADGAPVAAPVDESVAHDTPTR